MTLPQLSPENRATLERLGLLRYADRTFPLLQIDDLEVLLSAVRAEGKAGWQPIESAPRDGSYVDLWVHHAHRPVSDGFRIPDCTWANGEWIYEDRDNAVRACAFGKIASHWKPDMRFVGPSPKLSEKGRP